MQYKCTLVYFSTYSEVGYICAEIHRTIKVVLAHTFVWCSVFPKLCLLLKVYFSKDSQSYQVLLLDHLSLNKYLTVHHFLSFP